ncbi:helix-turn-helix domain-containing protein [Streptomyces sp. MBT53]|nr:helix-turn-helix domain-containing protein [Streptomyces sp. MBT53]
MAQRQLIGPGARETRIADVAYRWGFSGQAHFARLFRARFGLCLREARGRRRGSARAWIAETEPGRPAPLERSRAGCPVRRCVALRPVRLLIGPAYTGHRFLVVDP